MSTKQAKAIIPQYTDFNLRFTDVSLDGNNLNMNGVTKWVFAMDAVSGNPSPQVLKSSIGTTTSGQFYVDTVNDTVTVAVPASDFNYGNGTYWVNLAAVVSGKRVSTRSMNVFIEKGFALTGVITFTVPATSSTATDFWAAAWETSGSYYPNAYKLVRIANVNSYFVANPLSTVPSLTGFLAEIAPIPTGRRAAILYYADSGLYSDPADNMASGFASGTVGVWTYNALNKLAPQVTGIFGVLSASGITLDRLTIDNEEHGARSSYQISTGVLSSIMLDGRLNSVYLGVSGIRSQLTDIVALTGTFPTNNVSRKIYDAYNEQVSSAAINSGIASGVFRYYPSIKMGSYDRTYTVSGVPTPDLNGYGFQHNYRVGNASSPQLYGSINQITTQWYLNNSDTRYLSPTGTVQLTKSAWTSFMKDLQIARGVRRSDFSNGFQPWIAPPQWVGDNVDIYYSGDMRYHDELVRHICLLNPDNLYYFNPVKIFSDNQISQKADLSGLNTILTDVNATLTGVTFASYSTGSIYWDLTVQTSSAYRSDSKFVTRITVSTGSITQVIVDGTQILSLPTGQIGMWYTSTGYTAPVIVQYP